MLEFKIKTGPRRYVAPHDLRKAVGDERALLEIGYMIEYLMAELDMIDGDPDLECNGDAELSGDEHGDPSWPEWQSLPGATRRLGGLTPKSLDLMRGTVHEDDEDDDPAEEDDDSGDIANEDGPEGWRPHQQSGFGPGCPIADSDRDGDSAGHDPLPILDWREEDQDHVILPDPGADQRIMAPHRDRIRAKSYVALPSPLKGGAPIWRKFGIRPSASNLN